MQGLSAEGQKLVEEVAARHGVSQEAVLELLGALVVGQGAQAQFSHPDLGGMGQWSQGGMIMVGDMFNHGLKAKVDALCTDLSAALRAASVFASAPSASQRQSQGHGSGAAAVSLFVAGRGGAGGGQWWPQELGHAASAGSQNDLHYAVFPESRRLAINRSGTITVYDTGEHRITGFSQQQSGDQSLTFTSQHGLVKVADLKPVESQAANPSELASVRDEQKGVSEASPIAEAATRSTASAPTLVEHEPTGSVPPSKRQAPSPLDQTPPAAQTRSVQSSESADEIIGKIEKLAQLRQKNILTEEEFAAKKAELLDRL